MTFIKPHTGRLTLLAILALGLVVGDVGHSRPPPRDVELNIRGGADHYWKVNHDGRMFLAVRIRKGTTSPIYDNFRETNDGMRVGGRYMGYDLTGRSKNVLARTAGGQDTKWQKVGSRFEMRLRVPQGPWKGWWIGLGPLEPAKAGQLPQARLVLVEAKKDAAAFRWGDPYDEGP